MSVREYRQKPEKPPGRDGLFAARYVHGEPLDDVRKVAQMAFQGEISECHLSRGWVLVAVYTDVPDDDPARSSVEYVWDGNWLTYSEKYRSLCYETTKGLAHWYEEVLMPANPDKPCLHMEFAAVTRVARVCHEIDGEVFRYSLEVQVCCADCEEPFVFQGVPGGLSILGPACSPDGTELRVPICPESSMQALS